MKQVISIACKVNEVSREPARRSRGPMDLIKPARRSSNLVTLPFEKVRILYEGILQALEDQKKISDLVEAVIVKPITLGAAFNNVEVKVVISEGRFRKKFDFEFHLRTESIDHVKNEIIRKMKQAFEARCNALKIELDALEKKVSKVTPVI